MLQAISRRPETVAFVGATVVYLAHEASQPRRKTDESPSYPKQRPGAGRPSLSAFQQSHLFSPSIVTCERIIHPITTDKAPVARPSWIRKTLAYVHLVSLPLPRRLVAHDRAFLDSQLQRGLRQRQKDEAALLALQQEAVEARQSQDLTKIQNVMVKISTIAYGKGVTPDARQEFLVKYGCTGWTDNVLDTLVDLAESRGIVEIGAGHGQWARALCNHYEKRQGETNKASDFVLAFDDMSLLPISPYTFQQYEPLARQYFSPNVQKMEHVNTVLRQQSCRGRVLLLVYPPPGSMALETVQSYVKQGPENETVVYVGEGRGGANANNELFEYLESGEWVLLQVLPVQPPPGNKGYEKLYILQRAPVGQQGVRGHKF